MKDSLFLDICKNDYRAVFQMVHEAIDLCSDELWDKSSDEPAFWQQAYHTIMFIDFYLADSPKSFQKPTFVEDKAYDLKHKPSVSPSKQQMLAYLEQVMNRCDEILSSLTAEQLEGENPFHWTGPTSAHRLIYNIRHAQHHVGWLNSMLSRKTGKAAEWIITAK